MLGEVLDGRCGACRSRCPVSAFAWRNDLPLFDYLQHSGESVVAPKVCGREGLHTGVVIDVEEITVHTTRKTFTVR